MEDTSIINLQKSINELPYRFVDIHRMNRQVDVKVHTYGSKFEIDATVQNDIKNNLDLIDSNSIIEPTVLINHARSSLKKLMIEKGICYLRAGDSKGSVLVTSGF